MIESPSRPSLVRGEGGRPRARWAAWVAGLALALAGCATWHPAPVDLADPVWTVRRGQAVWHPAGRDLEVAGELLGATAVDGRGYVHFSKSPLLVAELRMEEGRWRASFPFLGRRVQGAGEPPGRLAWAQWIRVAQGKPPGEGWSFQGALSGSWRLVHEENGEWLEGVADP